MTEGTLGKEKPLMGRSMPEKRKMLENGAMNDCFPKMEGVFEARVGRSEQNSYPEWP